jgi:leucyl aminopeptidase
MSLRFTLSTERPTSIIADAVIVGLFEDKTLSSAAAEIDEVSAGALKRLVDAGDVVGKFGVLNRLYQLPGIAAPRVIVVGLGDLKKFDALSYTKACAEISKSLTQGPIERAANFLPEIDVPGRDAHWKLRQCALVSQSHTYRYTATLKTKKNPGLAEMIFRGVELETAIRQAEAIGSGVNLAKDLSNLPPNICNPSYLAEQARKMAQDEAKVSVEILEQADMAKLGMGALLAVGQGSANSPKLIVLRYQGTLEATKPYALVGKGITFDSGGLNLKTLGGIEEMKFDMCGAATVLGTFLACARLQLPINLVCVVPAVENMPDGLSYRPSDVLTSMSGQTIEVLNTDAEGRLILCDALTYTQRFEPQAIIDVATLTGACVVALGKHAHGLMSKHDDLAQQLLNAGDITLDRAWRLPLWDDYQRQLESSFADMANIGGKSAGAITAGCFLSRFTEGQRWAHLDIAGTAWDEGRKGLATGRPVPLLTQWLIERSFN